MENKPFQIGSFSISGLCKVVVVLAIISIMGGCIGNENKPGLNLPDMNGSQNASQNDTTLANYASDTDNAGSNMLRLFLKTKELNKTNKVTLTLQLTNPRSNETVITVFKPQFGQEWYDQTNITHTADNNWTQNYSIKRVGNISFVRMFVQVSENGTVVRRAAWNITFGAPGGEPK